MHDVIYVGVSIGFFALLLGYVQLCRLLGRRSDTTEHSI